MGTNGYVPKTGSVEDSVTRILCLQRILRNKLWHHSLNTCSLWRKKEQCCHLVVMSYKIRLTFSFLSMIPWGNRNNTWVLLRQLAVKWQMKFLNETNMPNVSELLGKVWYNFLWFLFILSHKFQGVLSVFFYFRLRLILWQQTNHQASKLCHSESGNTIFNLPLYFYLEIACLVR